MKKYILNTHVKDFTLCHILSPLRDDPTFDLQFKIRI